MRKSWRSYDKSRVVILNQNIFQPKVEQHEVFLFYSAASATVSGFGISCVLPLLR